MLKRTLLLALLSFVLSAAAFAAEVGENRQVNNGQDITRPLSRIDARYQYQLLKGDRPILLNDYWGIGLRADLPCDLTNKITSCFYTFYEYKLEARGGFFY